MGHHGRGMFVKADEPTTIEHMLDHYDHVRTLGGAQHLGLGSDMDLDGYDDLSSDELRRLRASYKDSYGFREKIDIEGVDHPQACVRPDGRLDTAWLCRRGDQRRARR